MSVKIRLKRVGANNDIAFRVVATDSRWPRDGKRLELLGWYDPERAGRNFEIKEDRLNHWISKGAIVSATVRSLMKRNKAPKKKEA